MSYLDLSESRLVSLALQGDEMAFRAIYEIHVSAVRSSTKRFFQWESDIDDVVMESFQKAFSKLKEFDPERELRPWLLTIARRTALDHLERIRREQRKKESIKSSENRGADDGTEPLTDLSPEDEIIHDENHNRLMAYLEELSPLYKEVMIKYMVEELEYEEIARETGLELNTVRTRIRRGKQHLAEMMLRGEVD